ncbi:MAG TPA: orotate phosphoribosyltransferase [Candidatus Marinimicrobia bacterium]|jgi:orotate phosphoribosyltransferase|nr:orotate phosphoribosyltransferase [Candidatus Neomarinimicrobiota bacterium]MDP7095025.1 orotate phosphoribosyltransferase [Candidatus Neomarinimicrobiota bacterium]MDP7512153.1 orotate phosphoribosyltransferase [Candidatus Neomarinimicrobiota bacterium]HBR87129.1 orotate phosphoribosyltransferase [Candidatus Neomarinimicrobiota bacterium]|tara:strand:- start:306 stop:878 length:573 start_codon:yes stop_codon:yes gene_type:complete
MTDNYLEIFKETGALLEGHFVLTSGRHSATYFQCAKVLQHPEHLSHFAETIVDYFSETEIDTVISPAVGGIVIGTEVGRQFGVKTIFAERQNGKMTLRRGFEITNSEKILVVEDVITTGGSVKEVMDVVEENGGIVVGVGVVVDRGGGNVVLHENQFAVTTQTAMSYHSDEIPEDLKQVPIEKPGSRSLK